jgi:acyl-CoA-binding protein
MFNTFAEASTFISTNKHMTIKDDEKLMLYALYKMSVAGLPEKKIISLIDIKEQVKYKAWTEFSEAYSCEDAPKMYVALANQLYTKYMS